jgi:hypothetical protein
MPLLALLAQTEPQAIVAVHQPAAAMPLSAGIRANVVELGGRVPVGIQRPRRKNWQLPATAVSVSRGTVFANPFARPSLGHARSVLMFEDWLPGSISDLALERRGFGPAEIDALHRLRVRLHDNLWRLWRKDLVCSCPLTSPWCHRKALIAAANEDLSAAQLFEAQRVHNDAAARERAGRNARRSR